VLADENRLPAGAPIFQPGLLDGGNASTDKIAALTKFVTLKAGSPNTVDCAIAEASSQTVVSKDILYSGPPQGTEAAAIDMAVHKFGRTTGYTVGQVTSIDTDVTVGYDLGNLTFTGQIIIVGSHQCWIKDHILPAWGDRPFTELKARPVDLWLKSLPLAPKSRVHIRGVISRLWKFAMYAEIVPREVNPMELVEIKNATKTTRKPRSITVEEFRLFLEKLEEPYMTMALVCICLGLRISEALGLKWGDVDWLAGCGKTRFEASAVPQNSLVSTTQPDKKKVCVDKTSSSWMCST
jgi:hypothetical protein